MEDIYLRNVALGDEWTELGLERQVMDPASRFYGGVRDPLTGLAWPSHVGGAPLYIATWTAALLCKESRYYRSEPLAERLELAADFQLRSQHADGTISPGFTNMHSPPDTAFVVSGLAQTYELMISSGWEPLQRAAAVLRRFLEGTVPAMLTGGCHTPNHRWVLTAALGFLYRLTGEEALRQRAEVWLAEGIDCTSDGEWTERSNGIYNAVSNLSLYYTAELLELQELLEPVRRNLYMMRYLIHPNGEAVTDYSGRQDFGTMAHMGTYFVVSALMAWKDGDAEFSAIASLAGKALTHPGGLPNHTMTMLLRHPDLLRQLPAPAPLPDRYRIVLHADFPRPRYLQDMASVGHGGVIYHSRMHTEFGAALARHRDGRTSATIMTESPSLFSLRHGEARLLGVRIATAFEPGIVKMHRMETIEGGYRLQASEAKGYYGPLPPELLPDTSSSACSPWYLLPHHLRELTHEQQHRPEAELTETESGWLLRLRCEEPELLMTQVILLFGSESELSGPHLEQQDDGSYRLVQGTMRCRSGTDWIEVQGGALEHLKPAGEGALPRHCQAVAVNLLTPYDHTIAIRLSSG
ncbi:hypothetical protein [Paenibacillus sp. 1P07SE]|uniref:hypothetical protein n=1 Tax=Paenibacillus sp. 1P07SE TaxID=3132209 RepID=UPI0039A68BB7